MTHLEFAPPPKASPEIVEERRAAAWRVSSGSMVPVTGR